MDRFGFGSTPPIDLPEDEVDASGVYDRRRRSLGPGDPVDVARVAIGQERLLATPLQMAEVAAAVANGGKLMKPQIWSRVVDPDGRVDSSSTPPSTASRSAPRPPDELTTAMEGVVSEGTGTNAAIPGVQVAGKTGTAETPGNEACGGGVDENQAWFIGFAPADDPQIAIAASVECTEQFGDDVAAPIFRDVAESLLKANERIRPRRSRWPEVSEGSVVDGRYRVLRRIGAGGMADVWLAEDTHLQRQVALKVLHRRFAQDREFVERFRREAESAAGLQHPNIVAVFDRGEFEGTYYIAMQYVEGPTLKQLIDRGLTPEQAVALVRQVLEAARFAHRNGIVHRDLKPQNVIVDDEGMAVVTDFGIARAGVSEITQTGSVMGTPQYLSPEQAQGYDVTAVSDLYSVGVILYEALTGRVPFEGESAVAVAMKQVSQVPQRPSSINPQVSPALDAVVMRALEKDPGERFQSADAFIAALDAAMKDPGAGRRHRRPSPRCPRSSPSPEEAGRGGRPRGGGAQAPPQLVDRRGSPRS